MLLLAALGSEMLCTGLIKQPTFCEATTGFSAECRLRNEQRISLLMMHHHPVKVVTHHQYGISALCSLDVISQGNQWWCGKILSAFTR